MEVVLDSIFLRFVIVLIIIEGFYQAEELVKLVAIVEVKIHIFDLREVLVEQKLNQSEARHSAKHHHKNE